MPTSLPDRPYTHLSRIWNREGRRDREARPVFRSCINTAEYIIKLDSMVFKSDVFATFGSGVQINISQAENFNVGHPVKADYPFMALPVIGEGLMLLRKTATDEAGVFNMHFGAVVGMTANSIDISDNSAEFRRSEKGSADLVLLNIAELLGFYGGGYDPAHYYIGLLTSGSGSAYRNDPTQFTA